MSTPTSTDTSIKPRTLRNGQFCWLDTSIVAAYGPQIGAHGIAVYVALATHASHDTQACWPSIQRIASLTKLGRSTVKRALRTLEATGLVHIQARQDGEGDPTSNLYTLLDPTVRMLPQQDTQEEGGLPQNPPPVTSEPPGGLPQTPEPDPSQPEDRTTHSFAAAAKAGKPASTPRYDEALTWNKIASLPPLDFTERPDAQLTQLSLADSALDRLRTEAVARLMARGAKRDYLIEPIIHAEMLVVYEEAWAPCAHVA